MRRCTYRTARGCGDPNFTNQPTRVGGASQSAGCSTINCCFPPNNPPTQPTNGTHPQLSLLLGSPLNAHTKLHSFSTTESSWCGAANMLCGKRRGELQQLPLCCAGNSKAPCAAYPVTWGNPSAVSRPEVFQVGSCLYTPVHACVHAQSSRPTEAATANHQNTLPANTSTSRNQMMHAGAQPSLPETSSARPRSQQQGAGSDQRRHQ